MTPLNVRSGPGPQYPVIGAIPTNGQATVLGCIEGSLWCQVSIWRQQGWAYSKYLTARSPAARWWYRRVWRNSRPLLISRRSRPSAAPRRRR